MGTYAVGDIHGCFDEWIELKNRIEHQDEEAKFILLGDIIDRGPKQLEMLRWAMDNVNKTDKYRMIMGNHDHMKIAALKRYLLIKKNYGDDYCDNFLPSENYNFQEVLKELSEQERLDYLQFNSNLPYYEDLCVNCKNKIQHYILVHAAITEDMVDENERMKPGLVTQYIDMESDYDDVEKDDAFYKEVRNTNTFIWERNYWGYSWLKDTIVINGHTPTSDKSVTCRGGVPGQIFYVSNAINIDCGCVFKSSTYSHVNLAAIRLEDLREFYLSNSTFYSKHYNYERQQSARVRLLEKISGE